ncbi:hypothetical protein SEA_LILHUDDY_60 [Arthrobacter phage LilHuddy]|nr:hypothetical protein SEA_LILHUDDY_60 [Arthrobacter phage LilHuddy]
MSRPCARHFLGGARLSKSNWDLFDKMLYPDRDWVDPKDKPRTIIKKENENEASS